MFTNHKGKYILYGSGFDVECFLFQNPDLIPEISFCIDDGEISRFQNISVYRSDTFNFGDYVSTHVIIVAADSYPVYEKIKNNLLGGGLREWDDFIWLQCFRKKIAVINANCYGGAVRAFLSKSAEFNNEYTIYPLPPIQQNEQGEIDISLLQHTDLYIHQDIRAENQFGYKFSDEYIKKFLSTNIKDICIPNLVGMGLWMYPNINHSNNWKVGKYTSIMAQDTVLDEAVSLYDSFDEIKAFWLNYRYDDEELEKSFVACMEKIKDREKNWDIKVYDYIKDNYNRIPCFTDVRHISIYVMRIVMRQLADLLGLYDIDIEKFNHTQGFRPPLLICVSEYFKLDFQVPRQIRGDYLGKKVMDEVDDYIKAYCYGFYGMIL